MRIDRKIQLFIDGELVASINSSHDLATIGDAAQEDALRGVESDLAAQVHEHTQRALKAKNEIAIAAERKKKEKIHGV